LNNVTLVLTGFQVGKQVEALFEFRGKIHGNQTDVDILRRAMATMQHHDAVTGTEKQHVAEDYAQRMRYYIILEIVYFIYA